MDSRFLAQRTGWSRRVAGLFLLLAAAALSVVLLRPVCEVAFAHWSAAQASAPCCESVQDGTALDLADLATPGSGAKHLAGPFLYPFGRALLQHAAVIFARPALPARSYYTRSTRILR